MYQIFQDKKERRKGEKWIKAFKKKRKKKERFYFYLLLAQVPVWWGVRPKFS